MIQNVGYLNGPPSNVTWPYDYQTPIMSSIQMNLLFSIQMVTVFESLLVRVVTIKTQHCEQSQLFVLSILQEERDWGTTFLQKTLKIIGNTQLVVTLQPELG